MQTEALEAGINLAERHSGEALRAAERALSEIRGATSYPLSRAFGSAEGLKAIEALTPETAMQPHAVVLSGGGTSMSAHAGVTRYLEERGILRPDTHVIGVSAGSAHQAMRLGGVPWHEQQALLNETLGIHQHHDLLDIGWGMNPMSLKWGNGALDGLPRRDPWPAALVDETLESWQKLAKIFGPWSLGVDTAVGELRGLNRTLAQPFGTLDGMQVETLEGWQKLAKRLDLDRRIDSNTSFLAYDPKKREIVEFKGGPGDYDVGTALAASTAFNDHGLGAKPIRVMVGGYERQLIDLGLEHNHPTWQLPPNEPAIVSRLFVNGPNRPGVDIVIPAMDTPRRPFERVNEADIAKLYQEGYEAAKRILAPALPQ